jgi:RNA polymerase sigma factor (sigma-70 family)
MSQTTVRPLSADDRLRIAAQRHIDVSSLPDTDMMLTPEEHIWVANNLGIAGRVARKLSGPRIDFDEARSAAYYGLCRAVMTWDKSKKAKRSTHAWWTCYWFVKERMNYIACRDNHGRSHRRPITFTDLARDEDFPYDPESPDLDEEIKGLRLAILCLPDRLSRIIRMRLEGMSLLSIGKTLGVSKERVRQLESDAKLIIYRSMGGKIRTRGSKESDS